MTNIDKELDFDLLDYIEEELHPLAKKLESLTPHPNNPRGNHDIRVIANSLKEYKQRTPIVVNKTHDLSTGEDTFTILKGNGTWYAAQLLGWDYIAAVTVVDDPDKAMGYTIIDNQASDLSEWIDSMLLDGLEMIGTKYETGFTELDMDELRQRVLGDEFENDDFAEGDMNRITCPDCGHQFELG